MFPDLKVRYRLLMMPLLATAALFIIFVIAQIAGSQNQRLLRSLRSELIPTMEYSADLEATLVSIQRTLQDAAAGQDQSIVDETEGGRDRFLGLLGRLRELRSREADELFALEAEFLDYYDLAAEATVQLIFAERTDAELVTVLETMTKNFGRLKATLSTRTREARRSVDEAFAATVRNDSRARMTSGAIVLGSAVLLCIVSVFVARSLTKPLSELVEVLRRYAGDTTVRAEVTGASEVSELGAAFNEMMDKIDLGRHAIESHSWMMTGLTSLSDSLASKSDLKSLGDGIVSSVARHAGALVGALYLADEGESFVLAGEYGCAAEEGPNASFRVGEGLLGQAAKDHDTLQISPVPAGYFKVSSGLGTAPPRALLIASIESDGRVAGVIELGSYSEFTDNEVAFLELTGERIAIAVEALRNKLKLQQALDETRQKGHELEESRKELARANSMLEQKTVRLETSNQDLESFAYVASHDLQEPLRKIEVYGQRLEQKCGEDLTEQGREYLTRMRAASGRMRSLISDLLGFSRVTTRAEPFCSVDIGLLMEQVLSDLEVTIEEAGAKVEVEEMPTVMGDPTQLSQVFLNLITNGLKFRRQDVEPRIKVSARSLNGKSGAGRAGLFEIAIEDNGIGIEERHFGKIFEVFQRLHGRSEYAGTGIGLALCRKIVGRHGGEVSVQSRPGHGSRFSVILPADSQEEERTHESAA